MNNSSMEIVQNIFNLLKNNSDLPKYGVVPDSCAALISDAVSYKRNKQYDMSISCYGRAATRAVLTTEMLRGMCKTLCCMNEYLFAFAFLFNCARVKWSDTINIPTAYQNNPMYSQIFGQFLNRQMPTQSAVDYYELRDAILQASNGDLKSLFNKTKAMSGQSDYQNCKPDIIIVSDCKYIVESMKWAFSE